MAKSAPGIALAVLAAGAFFWLVLARPAGSEQILVLQGSTMGTTWHVQLVSDARSGDLERLQTEIAALLFHYDREVFSTWSLESELSRLNASTPGAAMPLSDDLMAVLQLAQQLYQDSEHAFDISIAPLVNLWGFGPEPASGVPDAATVAAARARLGLKGLVLDDVAGTAVRTTADLMLDLSGIAKGYAVDGLAEQLLARGHTSFLAEIGGEMRLQGLKPGAIPWVLAVEQPQSGLRAVFARLNSRGEALAVAGSGDYRNYRLSEGRRYSHEIDPRSGYPVDHELASVTVIGKSAAVADAWATALMVLGPEEGMRVAAARNLAAYFIMHAPEGLANRQTPAFERFLYEDGTTEHVQESF